MSPASGFQVCEYNHAVENIRKLKIKSRFFML